MNIDKNFATMSQFGQDLLVKARKTFSQAEIIIEAGTTVNLQFDSGQLTTVDKATSAQVGLRIIHNDRIGVTGAVMPQDIDRLLQEARTSALHGDKAYFSFPASPKRLEQPRTVSTSIPNTPLDRVISNGKSALNYLHRYTPDFLPRFLLADWSWGWTRIANSHGLNLEKSGTQIDLTVDITRNQEGDFLDIFESYSSRRWDKNLLDLAKLTASKAKWCTKIVPLGSGPFTVVFPPKAAELLLDFFPTALNGRHVNDKSSRFTGKIGQQLFDSRLNLINSALEDWQPGSEAFDDEGVPTTRRPLVEKGVLKGFVYDLQEAGKTKIISTGAASRHSPFLGVKPMTNNLLLLPGQKPWSKILSGIKRGILVDYFVGSGQGNAYNGDFSVTVTPGFLIDHGEIVGRVKGVGLAGNVFDLLKDNLIDLSKETEWSNPEDWNGTIKAPYITLSGVSVTAKS